MSKSRPRIALTQGDPAGIGPELLLAVTRLPRSWSAQLVLIVERAALEAAISAIGASEDLVTALAALEFSGTDPLEALEGGKDVVVIDPVGSGRTIVPGRPAPADARAALAALDLGIELAKAGRVDALLTAPINKATIAQFANPDFRGHTEYLAESCGLETYGRDFLMAFRANDFRVALLNTHLPLREALDGVRTETIVTALRCLHANLAGSPRIAVAGLNPHAGEDGLLGHEDAVEIAPAVAEARRLGIDTHGPFSPDSVFARCRNGEFDWVLAMYHDQGLIAVKTVAFGGAINWTLGLPFLRTSVDHGTAYEIAGTGQADVGPLVHAIDTTIELLEEYPESEL